MSPEKLELIVEGTQPKSLHDFHLTEHRYEKQVEMINMFNPFFI